MLNKWQKILRDVEQNRAYAPKDLNTDFILFRVVQNSDSEILLQKLCNDAF